MDLISTELILNRKDDKPKSTKFNRSFNDKINNRFHNSHFDLPMQH